MVERDRKRVYELRKKIFGPLPLTEDEEVQKLRYCGLSWGAKHALYLSTKRWARLRSARVALDGNACVRCREKDDLHVDHVRYVVFGEESLDDLRTLCRQCHAKKTMLRDLNSGASGYKIVKRKRLKDAHLFDHGGWR